MNESTQPRPAETEAPIDYRRTSWGHNLEIRQGEDGLLRGHVWNRRRVQVGSRMIWNTVHGTTTGEVVECEPCMNPSDMYYVVVKVVDRCVTSPADR